jgi:hypothetical protein
MHEHGVQNEDRCSSMEVRHIILSFWFEPEEEVDNDTISTYHVVLSREPTLEEQDELLDLELELGMANMRLYLRDGTEIPMTNVYNF